MRHVTVVAGKVKMADRADRGRRPTKGGWLVFCSVWQKICDDSSPFACQLMPTYEYSCEKCGKTFEAFQSMRDDPFRECPKELCQMEKWGHGKVKRLPGLGAGLIFKGSGFYITDYRSNSYKEGAKKDAPADSATKSEQSSGTKESSSSKTAPTAAKSSEAKPKKQAAK